MHVILTDIASGLSVKSRPDTVISSLPFIISTMRLKQAVHYNIQKKDVYDMIAIEVLTSTINNIEMMNDVQSLNFNDA